MISHVFVGLTKLLQCTRQAGFTTRIGRTTVVTRVLHGITHQELVWSFGTDAFLEGSCFAFVRSVDLKKLCVATRS